MMGATCTKIAIMSHLSIPLTIIRAAHSSVLGHNSRIGFKNKLNHSFVKFVNSLPNTLDYPKELDVLKPLNQIYLNQTKILTSGSGLTISLMKSALSAVELDATNKKGTVLLKISYTRGNQPQDHKINVYSTGEDKIHLADMDLERSFQYKGCILCVRAPPGNLVGYAYELPGISQIAIVENGKREAVVQILMNGEFGWSNSAQILSAKGDRKLGRMYKKKSERTMFRNTLNAVIHLPTDLPVPAKLTLIGTCLNLMGRYQN